MEQTIFFLLRSELSTDEQKSFLDRIRKWNDIAAVGRINPKATDSNGVRKCFLYTRSGARAETVMTRLRSQTEVETGSVQPLRLAAAI
jgi:membrane-bound lytic murein transglycosylase MltF